MHGIPKALLILAAESYLTVLHRKSLKYARLPNRYHHPTGFYRKRNLAISASIAVH
jgi:hypothetical protein